MADFKWRQFQGDIILGCVRWYFLPTLGYSWPADETKGKPAYFYKKALDRGVYTINFCIPITRNSAAAKRFLAKDLRHLKEWEKPRPN